MQSMQKTMRCFKVVARLSVCLSIFFSGCAPTVPFEPVAIYEQDGGQEVVIHDNIMYISGAGLRIYDLADPVHPARLSELRYEGYSEKLAVVADRVYLPILWGGLKILDVSDPMQPRESFASPLSAVADGAAADESFLYLADSVQNVSTLRVFDITDASQPSEVARIPGLGSMPWLGTPMALQGEFLYLFSYDKQSGRDAFHVVDVSDPANPKVISSIYDGIAAPTDIVVIGDRAYIVGAGMDLLIVDISDPYHPRTVGGYNKLGEAEGVAVDGHYAYITNIFQVSALDISDPARPHVVAQYDTPQSQDVAVANGHVYVVDSDGLFIFRALPDR